MHKYGEADLLYRYQLSYKKAKKDKTLEVRIAPANNKSPVNDSIHELKISCIMSTA